MIRKIFVLFVRNSSLEARIFPFNWMHTVVNKLWCYTTRLSSYHYSDSLEFLYVIIIAESNQLIKSWSKGDMKRTGRSWSKDRWREMWRMSRTENTYLPGWLMIWWSSTISLNSFCILKKKIKSYICTYTHV